MIRPVAAERFLSGVLARLPTGVDADARLEGTRFTTMRFANGRIHQPHAEELGQLSLRIADARRLATVTTLDLSRAGVGRAIEQGLALARRAPEEPRFEGFSSTKGRPGPVPYSAATARMSIEEQGRWAARMIHAAASAVPDGRIAGVFHVGDTFLAVANTAGRFAQGRRSIASARVLVERLSVASTPAGWSEAAHFDHRALDPEALGREAAERVARSPPEAVPAGRYRVLLLGPAFAKLLSELGNLGFSARSVEEGWSCLARRWGRRIAPPGLEVVDDGRSPLTLPQAIDYEGEPKRRTPMVLDGVAQGPVLDRLTASRLGRAPTGHAWPPEAPWGEIGASPQNVIVGAGSAASLDELIRETGRGLLVTHFHYVRVVDPGRGVLTGMTRDGTYRIEGGELRAPVRNLRFTESILTALKGAELWGRERRCYADDDERGASAVTAPALVCRGFRFTSATVF
jgi:predicted Zn-dependent protease